MPKTTDAGEDTQTFDIVEGELVEADAVVDTTSDELTHAAKRMLTADKLADDASYYAVQRQARRNVLAMFHSHAAEVDITLTPYERATFDLLMNGDETQSEHLLAARWGVPHRLQSRWTPDATRELPAVTP